MPLNDFSGTVLAENIADTALGTAEKEAKETFLEEASRACAA